MKRLILLGFSLFIVLSSSFTVSAQFRYQSGRIIIGDIEPYSFYAITALANGVYLQNTSNRFLQIDVSSYGAPRVAGHNNQVVFLIRLNRCTIASRWRKCTIILMQRLRQASNL